MDRKCIFCETPIDIKEHGLTKFCSAHCRNKFYYQNKNIKVADCQSVILSSNSISKNEKVEDKKEETIGNIRPSDVSTMPSTRDDDSFVYSLIEAKFDAKIECNLYKLKCEKLEEEKARLERELFDVVSELDSIEDSEDSGPLSFLSGLPENVISGVSKAAFENEQIRDLITSFVGSKK